MVKHVELTPEEEVAFQHYRVTGFPYYPTDKEWRDTEYRKFMRCNYTINYKEQMMMYGSAHAGNVLCLSYQPHIWGVRSSVSRAKQTPLDIFADEFHLKRLIRKVGALGDKLIDRGVRAATRLYDNTQVPTNFRPVSAAAIYADFSPAGSTVFDMSAGWGGRMLGAHRIGRKYFATEPSTKSVEGLREFATDYDMDATIFHQGSEVEIPLENKSVDLCFTSPPYFNTEMYADEDTQSFIKFPTKESWRDEFLLQTMLNCHRILKDGMPMLINIANVGSYTDLVPDTIKTAERAGFTYIEERKYQLATVPGNGVRDRRVIRYEPILVFRKQ